MMAWHLQGTGRTAIHARHETLNGNYRLTHVPQERSGVTLHKLIPDCV
jgi:hypothetical protein